MQRNRSKLWLYSFITLTKLIWHYLGTCTFRISLWTTKSYKHQHTEHTVLSTDNLVENHVTKVTADLAVMIRSWMSLHPHVKQTDVQLPHTSLRSPLCIYKNGSGSSWKQMVDTVALFIVRGTHHRSQAHYQYKNIVQQFSCHSKHSYLSVNGPVTSAAIQIKKKKQT